MKTNIIKRFITIAAAVTVTFAISAGAVHAGGGPPAHSITIANPLPYACTIQVAYQYSVREGAQGSSTMRTGYTPCSKTSPSIITCSVPYFGGTLEGTCDLGGGSKMTLQNTIAKDRTITNWEIKRVSGSANPPRDGDYRIVSK